MFNTALGPMLQVELAANKHLLNPCYSVKIVYHYRQRIAADKLQYVREFQCGLRTNNIMYICTFYFTR
jgi:hypothetical protein